MTEALGLDLIAASAGSGKTHRLTERVIEAVDPRAAHPVTLEGLVAVTFTRRAAAELEARIRRRLVSAGAPERAHQLPLARVGTVHGVCLRLLEQFALEAGVSPELGVISGNARHMLRQALEQGIDEGLRARLEQLAAELEVQLDTRTRRTDWLRPVEEIMTLARGNRISPAALPSMGERSAARLLRLLGPAERDGDALDRELADALEAARTGLERCDDGQRNTAEVRETLRKTQRGMVQGRLRWSRWTALQKLAPGKKVRDVVKALVEVAGRVDHHPRLHEQVREFTCAVYQAAANGLEVYASWKRRRRLVDFVDMVDRALDVVALPEVRGVLAEQLELVVVDEFQDTSPVQLALFVELHALAGRSAWVGDRKQCIFEYAGADPTLMDAIARWVPASGGQVEALGNNWRSRPELVEFCSQLFSRGLEAHGFAPSEVSMNATRPALPELAPLPPLGMFWLSGKSREGDLAAIAQGVVRLLADPAATPVLDRMTGAVRPLRPADVAVLVSTNAEAAELTAALSRRGIRTSIARAGLLDTPEGTLVEAALGYLVDPLASRERAVIEALTGFRGMNPDAWLEALIVEQHRRREARERNESFETASLSPVLLRLAELRSGVELLAPSEVLDRVLGVLDLPELCARWPDPEQRLGNLDALRSLVIRYEARCKEQRDAASIAGLLRYFIEARQKQRVGDEELASDDQHINLGGHGVTVATYHKSKGLEWPVVILGSLDRRERRDAFDVCPESDRDRFDPADPLGGRWIRYFPWPFGGQRSAALADRAAAAPEGLRVSAREARERVRLLYVGFTRARDHLILAVRLGKRGPATAWLDELQDGRGDPLLRLPTSACEGDGASIDISGCGAERFSMRARVWTCHGEVAAPDQASPRAPRWFTRPEPAISSRAPYHIAPSRAAKEWSELPLGVVGEPISTGWRLALGSDSPNDWSIVGDVLHAFLAADLPELGPGRRLQLAARLLGASNLGELLGPSELLRAGDQLRGWIERQWPKCVWHRELPASGVIPSPVGSRRIEGVIDLLLETAEGVVLIDHKSYPGQRATWCDKAREYVPQLSAYALVLRMAGKRVLSQWVSFPVVGGVVQIHAASP